MIKYQLQESGVIDRETGASIPNDPANTDWQEYQRWLVEGNIPIKLQPSHYYDLVGGEWVYDLVGNIAGKQAAIKAECKTYIYSLYPPEIQASMSLGLYPANELDTMTAFIAGCIAEENRVYDLLGAATTETEITTINPIWPEV